MASSYDIVVIGSGANGLIAAAYMAKAGHKVLILERNEFLGGGVATREILTPGFKHDLHSATHILIQANPLVINDELGLLSKHGLKYHYPDGLFSTIFDDQTSIVTYKDVERSAKSIGQFSQHDADAYRRLFAESKETLAMIVQAMFVPPVPQGAFWALLDQSPQGRKLMWIMQASMLDVCNDWFEHEKTKIHLLKMAAETLVAPEEKGSGMVLYMMCALTQTYPCGIPVGGSGALVTALQKCLESYGAEFRTSAEVVKVLVEGGKAVGVRLQDGEEIRAKKSVIGQIHPKLLNNFFDKLDPLVVRNAERTLLASVVLKVAHYSLNEKPLYYAGEEPADVALLNFAPATLERYCRIFDDFRYGHMSKDQILAAHCRSDHDSTRAPAGKAALTLFGFTTGVLHDGGLEAWDRPERKDEARKLLHNAYKHYVKNLDDSNIIASSFETPLDMQRYSPTFQSGDVGGVGKYFNQIGGHRPTPELSQYTVPGIEQFYLAGTFMHPPGGVTGGGRATAIKMCRDMKINFDKLVVGNT